MSEHEQDEATEVEQPEVEPERPEPRAGTRPRDADATPPTMRGAKPTVPDVRA